jgi:CRISPR/Cas system CMR subunit Cmr4 (Cas7 group RAMP superfamily)
MSGRAVERIELAVDAAAANLFGAAVGFCVFSLLRPLAYPQPEVAGTVAFVTSLLLCGRVLRQVAATPRTMTLPRFEPVLRIEPIALGELILSEADRLFPENDELVLTDADRLHPQVDEPLELDDMLVELGADSRVVRLFDPSAMPTPGQLKDRIDRHLDEGPSPAAPADASQALFEALAQLRRSLA